jgi:hypothetical protein
MTTISIRLPVRPHVNQLPIVKSTARYNVIAAGRRFGKTEASKIRAIYRSMQARVWWLTPTRDSGTDAWRDFMSTFEPVVGRDNINKSERRITTPGGELRMVTADAFKRGAGIAHVFMDEAAFMSPNLWTYEIQPMLLESAGGADFLSSTNGRNWFWEHYMRGLDPEQPDWQAWHYTSYDNPLIDPAEIEKIRVNVPERVFEQEYLAAFLDDGGAVFRNLKACTLDGEPESTGDVVFGIDLGRHNDYTVIIAIDRNTRNVLAMDRFTDTAWEIQRNRILALVQRFKPRLIVMEENFNDSFVEALMQSGLPVKPFRTTNASKAQVVNNLAMAFEQSDIAIPNDAVLLGELQAFTVERLPAGALRYAAPAGMHDDTVIALALAWEGINNPVTIKVSRYA